MLDKAIALWPQLEGYLQQQGIFERADWSVSPGWSVFSQYHNPEPDGRPRAGDPDLAEEVEDAARLLGEMRRGCQQAEEQRPSIIRMNIPQ